MAKEKLEQMQNSSLMTDADYQKIKIYDEILKRDPHNIDALMQKGFILYSRLDNHALAVFQKILDIDPHNVDAYFWLAATLRECFADFDKSIATAKKGLAIDPNRADLHMAITLALYPDASSQEEEEYVYHLQQAKMLEPTWVAPRGSLIDFYIKKGNLTQAQHELYQALPYAHEDLPNPTNEWTIERYHNQLTTGIYSSVWLRTLEKWQKQLAHVTH